MSLYFNSSKSNLDMSKEVVVTENDDICATIMNASEDYTRELVIPYGCTKIRDYGMAGLTARTLTIPESVKSLGYRCFYGANITQLILPNSLETIDSQCFRGLSSVMGSPKITINKPDGSIAGAPWGANNATIEWIG